MKGDFVWVVVFMTDVQAIHYSKENAIATMERCYRDTIDDDATIETKQSPMDSNLIFCIVRDTPIGYIERKQLEL